MIYSEGNTREATRNIPTSKAERERYCLSDEDVLKRADYAIKVERLYSQQSGHDRPMDMEWAKDALDGELYMVQARPETVVSLKHGIILEYQLKGSGDIAITRHSVGAKIATGSVHVIQSTAHLAEFQAGEVLVADTTSPDWEPIMKIAAAIVTNRGGRTCHAALLPVN